MNENVTDGFSVRLMMCVRVLRSLAAGMISLIFPYLVLTQMHQTALTLALIYTSATVATAILGITIGFAADISRKFSFILALSLLPLSSFLLIFTNDLTVVFVAAVIGGYSATGSLAGGGVGGAAMPIQSAIVSDITSRRDRTFYYGLLSFVAAIAASFGTLAAGFVTINSALILSSMVGSISIIPALLVKSNAMERRMPKLKFKSGQTIGKFAITGVLNGFSQGLVTPFLIPFFILAYGVSRNEMSLYATLAGFIGAFSLLLAPRMERSLGFLRGVTLTRGVNATLAIIFPFVLLFPFSLTIYFVFPALRVAAIPLQESAMVDMVDSRERGSAFGINQGLRLFSSSVGTTFAGYEFNLFAIEVPFLAYAGALLANLGLYWRFFSSYVEPSKRVATN